MKTTARLLGLSALLVLMSACSDSDDDSAGSTDADTATTLDVSADPEAPSTTTTTGGGAGTLDDPRPIVDGTFTYTERFSDTDWAGQLSGLVELPLESYSEASGQCYAVVGIITPTRIGEGSVSEGFTAPRLGLVVDGVLVDDGFDCDTDSVRAAGYGSLFDAQVTVDTEFAFFRPILVEGDPRLHGR